MRRVWLIGTVVLIALVVVDWACISYFYALDDRPTPIEVTTADGWGVTAWFRPAVNRRFRVPVVLCHGLANNHAFMEFRGEQNLAKFLSGLGFDCYSLDLRGAGKRRAPHEGPWEVTIDDHVTFDLPALVDEVSRRSGSRKVVWIGHSLGGVVALAAASTSLEGRFAALITLGSPAFFSLPRLLVLMRIAGALSVWGSFNALVLRVIAPIAGRTPTPRIANLTANLRNVRGESQRYLVANVFAPIWKGVLAQLADWIRFDVFRSVDGRVDYRAGLARLTMPMLVVGGTRDHLAPPKASEQLFAALTTQRRTLKIFEGYGHGDLVIGDRAPAEVYPVVREFLEAHADSFRELDRE